MTKETKQTIGKIAAFLDDTLGALVIIGLIYALSLVAYMWS
jgi:hypothetical protein